MVATVVGRQRLRRGERHDAGGEVQAARGGDDERIVREPGGCQRRDGIRATRDGRWEGREHRWVRTWVLRGWRSLVAVCRWEIARLCECVGEAWLPCTA